MYIFLTHSVGLVSYTGDLRLQKTWKIMQRDYGVLMLQREVKQKANA